MFLRPQRRRAEHGDLACFERSSRAWSLPRKHACCASVAIETACSDHSTLVQSRSKTDSARTAAPRPLEA